MSLSSPPNKWQIVRELRFSDLLDIFPNFCGSQIRDIYPSRLPSLCVSLWRIHIVSADLEMKWKPFWYMYVVCIYSIYYILLYTLYIHCVYIYIYTLYIHYIYTCIYIRIWWHICLRKPQFWVIMELGLQASHWLSPPTPVAGLRTCGAAGWMRITGWDLPKRFRCAVPLAWSLDCGDTDAHIPHSTPMPDQLSMKWEQDR